LKDEQNKHSINRRDFVEKAATALAGITILPRYVLGGTRPDGSKYIAPSDIISLGFIGTGKQGTWTDYSFLSTNEVSHRSHQRSV
jgi:hypothetical protein